MKKSTLFFCLIFIICGILMLSGLSVASVNTSKKIQALEKYGKFPLYFTKNKGQIDQKVKFYERGCGHTIFFTSEEIVFTFYSSKEKVPSVVKLTPLGMRKNIDIVAEDYQSGKINSFNGKDSKKWKTNIPTYRTVVYREAYPGIDIKFYGNNQQLEYDIIVKKGGNPSQVKFKYSGIENFKITDKGDLSISLKDGGRLIQKKPVIYQETEGSRNYLTGKFRLHELPLTPDNLQSSAQKSTPIKNFVYGFEIASYNKDLPLVIDPVLVYSTYLGGRESDSIWGGHIAVDSDGNVYIAGSTESDDFPIESPLYPELWGQRDSFVTKMNATGTELIFSTYIGGSDEDNIKDIEIDSDGNIYITGGTSSDDFPVKNALFTKLWGDYDGFVTRIRATGDSLKFSTYLGGKRNDSVNGIALDSNKNIYVTGYTSSDDFPTKNPIYSELWGQSDAFVIKLKSDGSDIYYSTYLGGKGTENNSGTHGGKIAVDNNGNAYVVGFTRSNDFPTVNALYSNLWGLEDAFVTKIDNTGRKIIYSTYLGGTDQEWGEDIAVDSYGNAYVTGTTFSNDFPTKNALFPNSLGGSNAFITKIKPDGSALDYSTYLGGSSYEYGHAITVDTSGAVYVTGSTSSDDYPLKNQLSFSNYRQGVNDAFVTKLSPCGTSIIFSTYLGGNKDDLGYDIAVDSLRNIYVTGATRSSNFPTENPLYPEMGDEPGGDFISDAFVAKIDIEVTEYVPQLYGLFIGSKDENFRADLSAEKIFNVFLNLNNVAYSRLLKKDMDKDEITQSEIESAINEIKEKIHPGDILFLYIVAHGSSDLIGPETTKTFGDEFLSIGPVKIIMEEAMLTDDELYSFLNGMDDIDKWVIIDACHSGGFWGNNFSGDKGDLEKLKKVALLASSEEDSEAYYSNTGITMFADAIEKGFSFSDGYLRVDSNPKDDNVTFEEVYSWIQEFIDLPDVNYPGKIVFKMDFGDPIVFSSNMWVPVGEKTIDFNGVINNSLSMNPPINPEVYPIADANGPYTGTVGMSILFNANSSYDLDGEIFFYEWDFDNDGIYDEAVNTPTTTYAYSSEYTGLVKLKITDNDGLTAIDTALVEVIAIEIPGDFNNDGCIDRADYALIMADIRSRANHDMKFDLNGDGVVNIADGRTLVDLFTNPRGAACN